MSKNEHGLHSITTKSRKLSVTEAIQSLVLCSSICSQHSCCVHGERVRFYQYLWKSQFILFLTKWHARHHSMYEKLPRTMVFDVSTHVNDATTAWFCCTFKAHCSFENRENRSILLSQRHHQHMKFSNKWKKLNTMSQAVFWLGALHCLQQSDN